MFKWLITFLTFLFPVNNTAEQDYMAEASVNIAYSALLPGRVTPAKPKVPTKDCKTCNGTGRVRTGDDQNWTKCPDCEGVPGTGAVE